MVDCILLAGGRGTRLKRTVSHVPKPLAPIQKTPFLALLLHQLEKSSILDKVILALGYKAQMILDFVQKKTFPFKICYSVENTPLGTGGALKKAFSLTTSKYVLVMNGDSYFDIDLKDLIYIHTRTNADASIATAFVEDTSRFGKVVLSPENKILQFEEKRAKTSGFINGGIYLFNREIFSKFPPQTAFSIEKDVFPLLLKNHLIGYLSKNLFLDIGTKDSYLKAQKLLKEYATIH